MKQTDTDCRSHLAQFFLEWETFQTKVVEKLETHFMSNNFFPENCAGYVEKMLLRETGRR